MWQRSGAARRRPPPPRPPIGSICSSAWTMRPSCRCTPMASTRCRCKEKTLVWHLYQAAHRRTRHLLRPALRAQPRDARRARGDRRRTRPASTPATLAEIERYTKLFWINTGPFNNLTARKFVLTCTPEAFAAAAHAAAEGRRAVPAEERRDARSAARAPAADVLRSDGRSDGHRQDAAAGQGHPRRRARTTCTSA